MKTAHLRSHDGLPLTAYRAGHGPETLVIVNAPGMSIRFWVPVIHALQDAYTVVGFEYRGFPDRTRLLEPEELAFENHVRDLEAVLEHQEVRDAHLVSWCLGAKVSWNLYRHRPDLVASLVCVGPAVASSLGGPEGAFSAAMLGIRDRIERDPESIQSMITMMRRIGLVPSAEFFDRVFQEDEDGAVLSLMDMLEAESSMSTLTFYLLDHPIGLRNYLRMYEEFRRAPAMDIFPHTDVPVTVVTGSTDRITPMTPVLESALAQVPGVEVEHVPGASHFLPVEFPGRLARMIDAHVARATGRDPALRHADAAARG